MTYKFVINERLPSLNDYIAALKVKHGRFNKGASMKRDWQQIISSYVPRELRRKNIQACHISFEYFEPNRKRDPDNISGIAHKFILDTLVELNALENDNSKVIKSIYDSFVSWNDKNPHIRVGIEVL